MNVSLGILLTMTAIAIIAGLLRMLRNANRNQDGMHGGGYSGDATGGEVSEY